MNNSSSVNPGKATSKQINKKPEINNESTNSCFILALLHFIKVVDDLMFQFSFRYEISLKAARRKKGSKWLIRFHFGKINSISEELWCSIFNWIAGVICSERTVAASSVESVNTMTTNRSTSVEECKRNCLDVWLKKTSDFLDIFHNLETFRLLKTSLAYLQPFKAQPSSTFPR